MWFLNVNFPVHVRNVHLEIFAIISKDVYSMPNKKKSTESRANQN